MIVDELKEYKSRELRIMTLEQEKNVFCNDIEKIEEIEDKLKKYKFKQLKVDNACKVLNKVEEEIINKLYKDGNYRFENLITTAMDLHISYSVLRGYRKSALKKLEDWEKGVYL